MSQSILTYRLYFGLKTSADETVPARDAMQWVNVHAQRAGLRGNTIYPALGTWEGATERSLVYEFLAEPPHTLTYRALRSLASAYARRFDQAEVWLTYQPATLEKITGDQ